MNLDIFYDNGILNKNKSRLSWLMKNMFDLYSNIIYFNESCNINAIKDTQIIWHYFNNLNEYPICDYCGELNKRFDSLSNGYKKGCSKKCAILISRPEAIVKRKNNTIDKYGVEHTSQLESTKMKKIKTSLIKYGEISPSKSKIVKDKIKETNLLKYGYKTPLENNQILLKSKNTFINNYGVDNPSKSNIILEKLKISNNIKYGVDWQICSDQTKKSIQKTKDINYFNKYKEILKNNYLLLEYNNSILKILCNKCNEIFTINSNLIHQRIFKNKINICTICNPINNPISNGHNDVIKFLKDLDINPVINNRTIIYPLEIDILIPNKNIAIEYNGVYWHSDLYKDKAYHVNKRKLINENGLELIQIWEDDWTYKQDIIKSIIKSKLGMCQKIFARKCQIIYINNIDCRKFLNENHIQGWCVSKYNYGLIYNNELVSVCTFSKGRKNLNSISNNYELLRYCNKVNINVIGGLSKLFNKFINDISPNEIISYCDLDMFNGKSYIKIGMELVSSTISYTWSNKNNIRYNRWNFRKDKLVREGNDISNTANEIMRNNGWFKCYNSGCNKYKYKKSV